MTLEFILNQLPHVQDQDVAPPSRVAGLTITVLSTRLGSLVGTFSVFIEAQSLTNHL